MFWNRHPMALPAAWQADLEAGLEAGQTPLLDLGISASPLGGLPALSALHQLAADRVDVTMPLIVVGGSDAGWPAALLLVTARPQRSSAAAIAYAGADWSSYLASLTVLTPHAPLGSGRNAATPASMTPLFMPSGQADASLRAEVLPFALVEAIDSSGQLTALPDDWVTWGALGITVSLILLALLL